MSADRHKCLDGSPLKDFDFAALAKIGLSAVTGLWSDEQQSFRQSTIDKQKRLRPTVTFRCADVLLAVAAEQPKLLVDHAELLRAIEDRVITVGSDDIFTSSELSYPPFTAALRALATARVASRDSEASDRARDMLPARLDELRSCLPENELPGFHPFVQVHALRAASASARIVEIDWLGDYVIKLLAASEVAAEGLLARHHAGIITPAESVVLAFCAAALSTTGVVRDDQIALAALCAACDAQDMSGSWPLGRVVREEPSRLEISTYEVAWAVAETLTSLLGRFQQDDDIRAIEPVLEAVSRASAFSRRSIVELDDARKGWSSDHPYQQPRIESWTSAIALQFALASEGLRDRLRNRDELSSLQAISPRAPSWPGWLRWDRLAGDGEPDSAHPIYDYLRRKVVEPILVHPQQLPSGAQETASILLFGPPGTAKTTIVQALADRLDWPIVSLSPGTFIEQGLEAIEATAQAVFARLQQLRQVVVIFDECDELFRDRRPDNSNEQVRNISAFVTASMLPKLQDLHDRGKVLFVICTNHVDMMDKAVLRGGRIDHRVGVGPPDEHARQAILAGFRAELGDKEHLDDALAQLALDADRFLRNELKRAARKLAASPDWPNCSSARHEAHDLAQNMSEGLTISTEAMDRFLGHQRQWSDPILESA